MKNNLQQLQNMKPDDVNEYVHNLMGKMFSQQMNGNGMPNFNDFHGRPADGNTQQAQAASPLQTSVFETHEHVYVRTVIKDEDWLQAMKLYHTSNIMMIERIPQAEDKHTIVLPALVRRKGSKAQYQDGVLEIKLQKNDDSQLSEIDVPEV